MIESDVHRRTKRARLYSKVGYRFAMLRSIDAYYGGIDRQRYYLPGDDVEQTENLDLLLVVNGSR